MSVLVQQKESVSVVAAAGWLASGVLCALVNDGLRVVVQERASVVSKLVIDHDEAALVRTHSYTGGKGKGQQGFMLHTTNYN